MITRVNLCEANLRLLSGEALASWCYTSERGLCKPPSSTEAHAESEKTNSLLASVSKIPAVGILLSNFVLEEV